MDKVEDTFQGEVARWARSVNAQIKANISSHGIQGEHLSRSLKESLVKYQGEVTRVRFRFDRVGVYVHVGAGRGYGGVKGSRWTKSSGEDRKTKTQSLGKMGTGKRRAKPWLTPILEKNIPELEKIIEKYAENRVIEMFNLSFDKK